MNALTLEMAAGEVSAALQRCGVSPGTAVRVTVELASDDLDGGSVALAGHAFMWLDDEPELYSDADLIQKRA